MSSTRETTLGQRIRLARRHAGLETVAELADKVSLLLGSDVPASHVDALERDAVSMSGYTPHIALACAVRIEWLLVGEEPMVDGGLASELAGEQLTVDERRLLRGYRAGSPRMKKAILRITDYLELTMNPDYERFIAETRVRNEGRGT